MCTVRPLRQAGSQDELTPWAGLPQISPGSPNSKLDLGLLLFFIHFGARGVLELPQIKIRRGRAFSRSLLRSGLPKGLAKPYCVGWEPYGPYKYGASRPIFPSNCYPWRDSQEG
jgi:hypothetical protein